MVSCVRDQRQIAAYVPADVAVALAEWAEAEARSVSAQLALLVRRALREAGRGSWDDRPDQVVPAGSPHVDEWARLTGLRVSALVKREEAGERQYVAVLEDGRRLAWNPRTVRSLSAWRTACRRAGVRLAEDYNAEVHPRAQLACVTAFVESGNGAVA